MLPEDAIALATFFEAEAHKQATITHLLEEIEHTDREIDERVLDLYGLTNAADRQRILGSAPLDEDKEEVE